MPAPCPLRPCRYKAGEQVFLCYGRHTNLELLQHYGFVLPDNPHDVAPMPPRLLPAAVQQQLTSSGGGAGGGANSSGAEAADGQADGAELGALLHYNGAPSWELLRAMRLGCATAAERKSSAYLALADQPISAGSERAAFEALRAACHAALAELPTTIEQDKEEQLAAAAAFGAATVAAMASQAHVAGQGAAAAAGSDYASDEQQQQQRQQQQAREQQAAAERLQVVITWRLCHKRILQRGVTLCSAVLDLLPFAARPPAADIGSRIAALQRQPRW